LLEPVVDVEKVRARGASTRVETETPFPACTASR
jgi:hypothetical protein